MYSNLTGEVARHRQSDRLATAPAPRRGAEARDGRPSWIRHTTAAMLVAVASRLEPIRRNLGHEVASVAPELPCSVSPC